MRASLPAKSQAGFALAILAVFLIAGLSHRSFRQRSESAELVAHTIEVTAQLDGLLSLFQDAETGQHGFLLTGEERYLEPYETAQATLGRELARLRALVADDPGQLDRLAVVQRHGDAKLAELRETIALRRAGRTGDALAVVETDRGKHAMDAVRASISSMKDAERALLETRSRALESASLVVVSILWGGSALLLRPRAAGARGRPPPRLALPARLPRPRRPGVAALLLAGRRLPRAGPRRADLPAALKRMETERIQAIVIGGSAGEALSVLLPAIPADGRLPVREVRRA
jgi:CHASE3 domain sensor protein